MPSTASIAAFTRDNTAQVRFRESASRLPKPAELSAPVVIDGQQSLPLYGAGYVEAGDAWLREMLGTYGAGPEGAR